MWKNKTKKKHGERYLIIYLEIRWYFFHRDRVDDFSVPPPLPDAYFFMLSVSFFRALSWIHSPLNNTAIHEVKIPRRAINVIQETKRNIKIEYFYKLCVRQLVIMFLTLPCSVMTKLVVFFFKLGNKNTCISNWITLQITLK